MPKSFYAETNGALDEEIIKIEGDTISHMPT
jgi:hypothetical protein